MRKSGKLRTWHDDKGYGFIRPDAGGRDIFVHLNAFGRMSRSPRTGDILTYTEGVDELQRPFAASAVIAGVLSFTVEQASPPSQRSGEYRSRRAHRGGKRSRYPGIALLIALIAIGALTVAWYRHLIPDMVALAYGAASLLCLVLYGLDKLAARAGTRRHSEKLLLMTGLACGWPGALLGQAAFNHKTRKQPFLGFFWFTVILNLAGLFAYLYGGEMWLQEQFEKLSGFF